MSKNKYTRRRSMRRPTAGTRYQNELIQGPIQPTQPRSNAKDVGREAALQISESNNPNTRYVANPSPTTNRNELRSAAARQDAAMRNVQRQVYGKYVVLQVQPSGQFNAPRVLPYEMKLVGEGGVVRMKPVPRRSSIAGAVAGVAGDLVAQPLADALSDNVIHPILGAVTGADIPTMEELRIMDQLRIRNEEEVAAMDEENERLYQQQLEQDRAPIREGEAPEAPILPPPPSQSHADTSQRPRQPIKKTHSQSLKMDTANRDYQIKRAALGENPTKEDMDAVVAYGLEQHRKNFPHLYQSNKSKLKPPADTPEAKNHTMEAFMKLM